MSTDLARLDLRLRRRSMIGYSIGMAGYAFVIVALYPTFKDDASLDEFTRGGSKVAALFGASGPLTTPAGWLNANLYSNFLPLVVLLLTIGYGAHAIAGQDEEGTLGLALALPVRRRSILLQKFATMVLLVVPVSLATLLCTVAGRRFDLTVGYGNLVGVTIGTLLLGVDFGALALLVGVLTGSRGTAIGTSSTLAAAAYLLSSLAPVVHWMRPARFVSPFYYAVGDDQLVRGLGVGAAAALVLLAAALLGGALTAFDRMDVH